MLVIKRYSNRKLYDTASKRYITLDGIAELIRKGEEVHVVDHETGDDITAMTQAQIILEQERKLKGGLPRSVLTGLIQTGSDTLTHLRKALVPPAAWNADVNAEIERRLQRLVQQGALSEEEGLSLLDKLVEAGESPGDAERTSAQEIRHVLSRAGVPSREEVQELALQVEALTAELEKLSAARASRSKRAK
jgi:polyhydroxyalkanoate synthesis repressor PhaR